MGWGPANSSQNRSYNQISEKNTITQYISNWGYSVNIMHGSELYDYENMIAVNN